MTENSSKPFTTIRADYAFFFENSTEASVDIRAYAPHIGSLSIANRPIQILELGCGDGAFTRSFIESTDLAKKKISLTLVEPDKVYLQQAIGNLQPIVDSPITSFPTMNFSPETPFDLVVANHVFYYIANLSEVLTAVATNLSPDGLLLVAIAGQENTLIQFWNRCFSMIGKPVPYYVAEDFQAALAIHRLNYQQEFVQYDLSFEDNEENRLSICRFLFGDHFSKFPLQSMLDLFSPHAENGRIEMKISHQHFSVRRPRG